MQEWKDINTAPKDGTPILVWWPLEFHCPLVAHWTEGKWTNDEIGWKLTGWSNSKKTAPTHWMHLPTPPNEIEKPLITNPEHNTESNDCWCEPVIEGNLIIHNKVSIN